MDPSLFSALLLKASMIWIIGEYAERIDNADELLESFLESFPEEPAQVQLQLLTATVKLFLKKPTEGPQQMIQVLILFVHILNFRHDGPVVPCFYLTFVSFLEFQSLSAHFDIIEYDHSPFIIHNYSHLSYACLLLILF